MPLDFEGCRSPRQKRRVTQRTAHSVTIRSKFEKVARARRDGRLVPMTASWLRAVGTLAVNPAASRVRLHAPPYVEPDKSDLPLVRRIFASFRLMKDEQRKVNPIYQPSSLWQETFDAAFPSLARSLTEANIEPFHHFLSNFGAWPEYTGITWSPLIRSSLSSVLKTRHLQNEVFLRQAELWKWFYGNRVPMSTLSQPRHGNQYGAFIDGEFVTVTSFPLEVYAGIIAGILQPRQDRGERSPIVAELGAGYGVQAYYILSKLRTAAYLDLDLPETLCLAAYFLAKTFPDRSVLLYGESDFSNGSLKEHDLLFMPAWEIEKLPARSIDLFLNEFSLGEMTRQATTNYVQHIARASNYFFHVNHDRTRNRYSDSEESLLGGEYPIPPDVFTLLFRYPDWFHAINNGFFNPASDIVAYLYGRRAVSAANA
jgi:hypothetical protein